MFTNAGAVWASGIGATLLGYARTGSPMKTSLRLIHARMHAQALTLGVLSAAAAYRYYQKDAVVAESKPLLLDQRLDIDDPIVSKFVDWELF